MESREASNIIEEALNKVIIANEDHEDGDILVDWVVVAYVTNPITEKGSGYPMFFPSGMTPTYKARGLLTTGLLKLEEE